MISTLKGLFRPLKSILDVSEVLRWYLVSLAIQTPKHTLEHASEISGIHASQFSRLLSGSVESSESARLSKIDPPFLSKTDPLDKCSCRIGRRIKESAGEGVTGALSKLRCKDQ
jgi:hypothetical protein